MSDNLSGCSADQRESVGADCNRPTINARLAQICYILVCLQALLFGYIAFAHPSVYHALVWEDGWAQNLTAAAFLLAGVALLGAAMAARRAFPRCVYILGGAAMAFFAGEEVSWGQRIIGFETPGFLVDLNHQGEFNIHNISGVDVIFHYPDNLLFALAIAGWGAFFCNKDRILGVASPPVLMLLAFLIMLVYPYFSYRVEVELSDFPLLMVTRHRVALLLLLIALALLFRNARLSIVAAISSAVALAITYLNYSSDRLIFAEAREYLFSALCLFYALAALLDHGAARQKIAATVAALKPAAALPSMFIKSLPPPPTKRGLWLKRIRLTPWAVICALIVAGSIGLALRVHFDDRVDAAAFEKTYSLTRTIEPVARSEFDVYIDGRYLHYFKQPCDAVDTEAKFFLGAFPANVDDLRVIRRQHGFDNLDFHFDLHGSALNGACAARVRLPGYEIASVSTGQYIIGEDRVLTNLWIAEFPVGGE